MDWRQLLIALVAALAWPSAIVAIVLILKRPLNALLQSISGLRYGGVELEFGRRVKELGARADAAALPPAVEGQRWRFESPDDWTLAEHIERLAPISPQVAVEEAWRFVELAIRDTLKRRGVETPRSLHKLVTLVQEEGLLPRNAAGLLNDLRAMRNLAIHNPDADIEPSVAVEFGHIAERVVASLKVAESWENRQERVDSDSPA